MTILASSAQHSTTQTGERRGEQRVSNLHRPPARLLMIVDGRPSEIHPLDLGQEEASQALRSELATTCGPIVFVIDDLLRWDHESRWHVFRFIAAFEQPHTIRIDDQGGDFPTLFDAVLELMEGPQDVERCERGRRAAVEAAAITHPHALGAALSRILVRLQQLQVRGYRAQTLRLEAETALRALSGADEPEIDATYLHDIFPDAPSVENAIVPRGFSVSSAGVGKTNEQNGTPFLGTPLLITRRFIQLSDGTELIELGWYRDGRWHTRIVPRAVIATPRTLVELADFGLPVNSLNAADVVAYLDQFEHENLNVLPVEHVTNNMGWHESAAQRVFLWGRRLIATHTVGDGTETALQNITFRGADEGEEQHVDGFDTSGSFEAWADAMRQLAGFPRVRFAVYAALSSVLIAVLDTLNYVLSFSGPTSHTQLLLLRHHFPLRPIVVLPDVGAEAEAIRFARELRAIRGLEHADNHVAVATLPEGRDDPGECSREEIWQAVTDALDEFNTGNDSISPRTAP